jgi:hypothetical protein
MPSETQLDKMRIISRERFDSHLVSSEWFFSRALEWFDSKKEPSGFVLMQLPSQWTAVFTEDKNDLDKHPIQGHGINALEAVTNLLWEMRE